MLNNLINRLRRSFIRLEFAFKLRKITRQKSADEENGQKDAQIESDVGWIGQSDTVGFARIVIWNGTYDGNG